MGREMEEGGGRKEEVGKRREEVGRRREEVGKRREEVGRRREEVGSGGEEERGEMGCSLVPRTYTRGFRPTRMPYQISDVIDDHHDHHSRLVGRDRLLVERALSTLDH